MFPSVIRQLFGLIRGHGRLLTAFLLTLLLDLAFVSLAPLSFQFIIDRAVLPKDLHAFAVILSVLASVGVVCLASGVVSDFLLARLAAEVQRELRRRLFVRLQTVRLGYLKASRSGELLSLFTVDLPAVERALR